MGTEMNNRMLTLYDVTGIQDYIFGSNRLKENLGGSQRVHEVLSTELDRIVKKYDDKVQIQWSGGGNALVSSQPGLERTVARELSKWLIENAPGLQLVCAHREWSGQASDWRAAYEQLQQSLRAKKLARPLEPLFDGGGVTASCQSTGEPACGREPQSEGEDSRILGPAALAKLAATDSATKRLENLFPLVDGWTYSTELEHLGSSRGEHSFVGVIHFDGNGMGKRFKAELEKGEPGEALDRVKALSAKVNQAGKETLRRSLEWLMERLENSDDLGLSIQTDRKSGLKCFPVRPLVYGGDDITLVCDGRIALDLAAKLLEFWHATTAELLGKPAHACAGVALVKMRYPFFRAYKLAEALCAEAKQGLKALGIEGSALDYEVHTGGPMLDLAERRERFATVEDLRDRPTKPLQLTLYTRPYIVVGEPPATRAYQSWNWFRHSLLGQLQDPTGPWADFSSQLHRLASTLPQGREATRTLLKGWEGRWKKRLPTPKGQVPTENGFFGTETPYLDAIELLERTVPAHRLSTRPDMQKEGQA